MRASDERITVEHRVIIVKSVSRATLCEESVSDIARLVGASTKLPLFSLHFW